MRCGKSVESLREIVPAGFFIITPGIISGRTCGEEIVEHFHTRCTKLAGDDWDLRISQAAYEVYH